MRILCVGANHKTAPLALRERLAFDEPAARAALEVLRRDYPQAGFVILSTCNRCELYVLRPLHARPRVEEIRAFFGTFHHLPRQQYDHALYVHADTEAVRHLFDVAAGLDSLVPGEDQILAQVKAAYELARAVGTTNAELNELFQLAFAAAKEVRSSTRIGAGKVSVASVAVDLARQVLGQLAGRCVLSVGAGKMNTIMLRQLRRSGAGPILVANRSGKRAAELAAACGGQAVPFENLTQALADADVVVCSTGSPQPVITADKLAAALARRPDRPLLLIDIAVPRDVEPQAGRLAGVRLYNIDDLKAVAERNIQLRRDQLQACRGIIDRRTAEYFHRLHVREVAPTIKALYRHMRTIADEELAAIENKLTGQPQRDVQLIRQAFYRTLRRALHGPVSNLRRAAGSEAARKHADILRQLFNLPEEAQ